MTMYSHGEFIPFRDYMQTCLYHPEFGYYMKPQQKLGKTGDFYTSVSLGNLMAGCMLAHMRRMIDQYADGDVQIELVEWGGGEGKLAADMLDDLQLQDPALYARTRFVSIEYSPHHRKVQQNALQAHLNKTSWMTASAWTKEAEQDPGRFRILYANECLDAFPVHRVVYEQDGWKEIHVRQREDESWEEARMPLSREELHGYLQHAVIDRGIIPAPGQQLEVHLDGLKALDELVKPLANGMVLLIDYGDVAEELYSEHRMNGTFMCYKDHVAFDDPYRYPGTCDMTAHVNFSSCLDVLNHAGFQTAELQTQKAYLVENGLLEQLSEHQHTDPFHPDAKRNRAIRQLLWSDQMSELFKVLTAIRQPASS
ncbi:class I SAM-dependent methyltransferase [Marinicrinis sediminis]|uniref:Class I SAM-dependent methyltransferase n=1 Tax=Marinicrinis sediminis TaxID=1652465 RepID=A0ABW5RBF3_9BACL